MSNETQPRPEHAWLVPFLRQHFTQEQLADLFHAYKYHEQELVNAITLCLRRVDLKEHESYKKPLGGRPRVYRK